MKKLFLIASFQMVFSICTKSFSQVNEYRLEERAFLKIKPLIRKNTYLGDTIISIPKIRYADIKYNIKDNDTGIVKKILENGKVDIYATKLIINHLRKYITVLDFAKFDSLEQAIPEFSAAEIKTLNKIKEIDSLLANEPGGSARFTHFKKLQLGLFKSRNFTTYSKKLKNATKEIFLFLPIYRWKNMNLLIFYYYHSLTDSDTFVYLL